MELRVTNNDDVILQLSIEESDRILGSNQEPSSVLRDIYFFADDFFMEYNIDLEVWLDIGEPYGVLSKQGAGRYSWK